MNVIGVEDVRVGCPVSIDSLSDLNGSLPLCPFV